MSISIVGIATGTSGAHQSVTNNQLLSAQRQIARRAIHPYLFNYHLPDTSRKGSDTSTTSVYSDISVLSYICAPSHMFVIHDMLDE